MSFGVVHFGVFVFGGVVVCDYVFGGGGGVDVS